MEDSSSEPDRRGVTRLLERMGAGDHSAADQLMPLVYDELRARARRYLRGRAGVSLQPTALVHEAYLRLADAPDGWNGRTHFFAVAAIAMRQILLDHARHHGRDKRGGNRRRVTLDEAVAWEAGPDVDLLALGQALERLAALDQRQARIVELRIFAGMTAEEISEVLEISRRSVQRDWAFAKAWLRAELDGSGEVEDREAR
jgi:RNA polymerase sigma factor (TIGR02999 family)